MRQRAMALSGLASVALHALPLLFLVAPQSLRWPEAPLSIEVQAAHRTVPKVGPPAPGDPRSTRETPPAPRSATVNQRAVRPKAGPGAARSAALPPPPATADLQKFAPGDAKIVVLLRTDRLRKSPHKEGVQALLEALPDYGTLLGGTGLTPLDDFDALLIATANPFDVTATFLAARHADDRRLRAALERRTMPSWDPRVFRSLGPTLSLLTRPDAAARLDGAGVPDGGTDDLRARWLADLARFEKIADEPGGPSMMVTVNDLGALMQVQSGIPTPLSAALAATADASPAARLRLTFTDEDAARRFAGEWPGIVQRWRSATLLLGLASMLDGLTVKRDGATLDVLGRIPEGQTRLALNWAKALLPRPRPAAVEEAPDGGARDGG